MLKASSLFYALAITVILALVSSSLLLAAHYTHMRIRRDELKEEASRNAYSGMQFLLSDQSLIFTDEAAKEIDLFGTGHDSVLLQKKSWGAFEIAISEAHFRLFRKTSLAETGWQSPAGENNALVLADLDRPLFITGNTQLKGDCYLPKAGIQRAYIEGQSYAGDQLVYGTVKTAERFLPPCDDTLVQRLKNLFHFQASRNDSIFSSASFGESDSISNSFLKPVLYIISEEAVFINAQKISGQVCIISRKEIGVSKNASLRNVLLIAPKIKIADEVHGSFQAFASDSLLVGKKVCLRYPSVLGIIGTDRSPDFACLLLDEQSKVYGQLFACSVSGDFRKHVLISVARESLVYGEIYSSGLVDLQGEVDGKVICSKFELKTNSSEYENYLLNAVIDRKKRDPAYVSSALTAKKENHKAIVQWLE